MYRIRLFKKAIIKKGGKHNMMAENIYIEKLIQDKKVIQLKEYLQS